MGKFYRDKTCIYLDQFAVSRLCSSDPKWEIILALLKKGTQTKKLVIPYSREHLFESSLGEYDKAVEWDKILFDLSEGVILEIPPTIIKRLLLNKIRGIPTSNDVYVTTIGKSAFDDRVVFDELRKRKLTFNAMSNEGVAITNQHRASGSQFDKRAQKESINNMVSIDQNLLATQLEHFGRD